MNMWDFEFTKRKVTHSLQEKLHKTGFLSRNLTGQEREWCIQNAERKKNAYQEYFTQQSCPLRIKER